MVCDSLNEILLIQICCIVCSINRSSVPVIKNNNYESPWFWDMKMSGNTTMYWYLKNCVWFIKFHDKFEKLQDIKTISWVFLQNKKLTQCKRWHQITLFKTACLFLFFKWKSCISTKVTILSIVNIWTAFLVAYWAQ